MSRTLIIIPANTTVDYEVIRETYPTGAVIVDSIKNSDMLTVLAAIRTCFPSGTTPEDEVVLVDLDALFVTPADAQPILNLGVENVVIYRRDGQDYIQGEKVSILVIGDDINDYFKNQLVRLPKPDDYNPYIVSKDPVGIDPTVFDSWPVVHDRPSTKRFDNVIGIEGGDGTGKDTQCALLAKHLERYGFTAKVFTAGHVPGLPNDIYRRIIDPEIAKTPKELFAMWYAVHALALQELERAASEYDYVILNRTYLSTAVMQCDPDTFTTREIMDIFAVLYRPRLTLVLEPYVSNVHDRLAERESLDYFEQRDADWHAELTRRYASIPGNYPDYIYVRKGSKDAMASSIRAFIYSHFPRILRATQEA